jgi:hypothetical protein
MKIRWEAGALTELASAWLTSDSNDRRMIVAAAGEIDRQLLADPETVGESRPDNVRIVFVRPLGALFEVENDLVSVLHVWKIRKRR